MADRSDDRVAFHVLEITLMSAQDLKPPSNSAAAAGHPCMKAYAVVWVDPATKLRTLTDFVGGESPTWNEKFLFRVPEAFLTADSSSAVHVEIYAAGRIIDSLLGAVRFLVGNERLLSRPLGEPSFAAMGIRRPSGRFRGVLNIGSALLPDSQVSAVAELALARNGGDATGYRVLMDEGAKIRRFPRVTAAAAPTEALKERNKGTKEQAGEAAGKASKRERWVGSNGKGVLCGLAFQRKSMPADQNSSPSK